MNPPTLPKRQPIKRAPARRVNPRARYNIAAAASMPRAVPGVNIVRQIPRAKWLALLLIAALSIALYLFFDSDLFYAYEFDIAGAQTLSKKEIEKASGIAGYNIFFIEPREAERALAKLPEVKSARVTTALPNRVAIEIVERAPEIAWVRGNDLYWVTTDGIFLIARVNLPQLALIRDVDQRAITVGKPAHAEAVAAYRALRDAWSDGPRHFEWSNARGLSFVDERGWKIYLGTADRMSGKLAILRALIPYLVAQNKKINFVDLGKGEPYYQ
jgi:cell division septal protein FtsQ